VASFFGLCASGKSPAEIWRADAARAALVDVAKVLQCRYDLTHLNKTKLRSWAFAIAIEEGSEEQKSVLAGDGDHGEVYGQLKLDDRSPEFQRDLIATLPGKFEKVEPAIRDAIVNAIPGFIALKSCKFDFGLNISERWNGSCCLRAFERWEFVQQLRIPSPHL
jgi:hypothetical protein